MTLILGRKRGMTQFHAEDGTLHGVTVVEAGPCVVCQVRTQEKDGYHAVQLGFEDVPASRVAKPQRGHFKKGSVAPKRFLREERLSEPASAAVGDVYFANTIGSAAGAFTMGFLLIPTFALERARAVRWDMLDEWNRTRRAPRHAAWLHQD